MRNISCILICLFCAGFSILHGQVVSYSGGAYSENFDGMSSGTNTPTGWFVGWHNGFPGTNGAVIRSSNVTLNDGSVAAGGGIAGFNCGTNDSVNGLNRSLGTSPTSTSSPNGTNRFVEVQIRNNSGQSLSNFTVRYTGKQWRSGQNASQTFTNYLQCGTDGVNFAFMGASFDFRSPITTPTNSPLNGNLVANYVTNLGGLYTLQSPLPAGGTLFLRWLDFNDPGTDPVMAVDDFYFSAGVVTQAVAILVQPADKTTVPGSNATFIVTASGFPAFYQWLKNSNAISGATNASYTVTNTSTNDNGMAFQVIVSNSVNCITSQIARLAVLPPPWQSVDIGTLGKPGFSYSSNGTFYVKGGGSDVYGTADSFYYVYMPLIGNGSIIARVVSLEQTHDYAKVGVMIREQLSANSKHAMMLLTPTNGSEFMRRLTVGGSSVYINPWVDVRAPWWVKMERIDQFFTAYKSPDGINWVSIGCDIIPMQTQVYAGLAVTARDINKACQAVFDNVSVQTIPVYTAPGLRTEFYGDTNLTSLLLVQTNMGINSDWLWTTPYPNGPLNNFSVRWSGWIKPRYSQTYTFKTETDDGARLWVGGQKLFDKWIANPYGVLLTSSGTVTLQADTWYAIRMEYFDYVNAASARLYWSSPSQALEIVPTERLCSADTTTFTVHPTNVSLFDGATAVFNVQASGLAPFYYQWQFNGQNMPGETNTTLTITNVQFGQAGIYQAIVTNNMGIAASLPATLSIIQAPWQNRDVGAVGLSGYAAISNGTYYIKGGGTDIGGSADAYQFLSQMVTGNVSVTARVISLETNGSYAKAGVMIRETLNAGSRYASMTLTPTNGSVFKRRVTNDLSSLQTNPWKDVKPPWWVRLVRVGNIFTSYKSADGSNWVSIGSECIPMNSAVNVGLCVTANNNSSLNLAVLDNVSVLALPDYLSPGLRTEYYGDTNLASLLLTQTNIQINFNWICEPPYPAGPQNNFSIRWTGWIRPLFSENHTFTIKSDAGVRLWINEESIIDRWMAAGLMTSSGSILMESNQWYPIKLEYFSDGCAASIQMLWSSLNQPETAVPFEQLCLYPPPQVDAVPSSHTNAIGQDAVFRTAASGPGITYQWLWNGNVLSDNTRISGAQSNILTISSVQFTNGGAYNVVISNPGGCITSAVAVLTVDTNAVIPFIVKMPASLTVNEGDVAVVSVEVQGNPKPRIQWYHDGEIIPGANEAALQINDIKVEQSGGYVVVAENYCAAITSSPPVVLTVVPQSEFSISHKIKLEWETNGLILSMPPNLNAGVISVVRSENLESLNKSAEVLFATNTPLLQNTRIPVAVNSRGQGYFRAVFRADAPVILAQTNISSEGGDIVVPPDNQFAGLVLNVPSNSFSSRRTFTVSYNSLGNRRLSDLATPVTPLIHVDNGGGLSSEPMMLTIPAISVSSNEVVVASLLQQDTGNVSYVPVLTSSNGTMTIVTRHFCSAVFEKTLKSIATPIETGFWPGQDDWNFRSIRTFVEPRGACYAMSQSAIWFYKYKGNDPNRLHNFFDLSPRDFKTRNGRIDNASGIRFVGLLQKYTIDFNWITMAKFYTLFHRYGWSKEGSYWACYMQMKLSGQPQLITLSGVDGSHAVVAYAADRDCIYTADSLGFEPETTGNLYPDGTYIPPVSDFTRSYNDFFFIADPFYGDSKLISLLWEQVEKGTIGRDYFPSFEATLYQEPSTNRSIQIGKAIISPLDVVNAPYTNYTDKMSIDVVPQSGPTAYATTWFIVNTNGKQIADGEIGVKRAAFSLNLGTNFIGVNVEAASTLEGDRIGKEWAGYAWLTIVRLLGPPEALDATDVKTNGFTANWTMMGDVDGYSLDISTNVNFSECDLTNIFITNTYYDYNSARYNTVYYYRVRSIKDGEASKQSNVVSVKVPDMDELHAPVALAASNLKKDGFTANWTAVEGAINYAIDISETADFKSCIYTNYSVGNGTNVAFSGLMFKPLKLYFYRVRALTSNRISFNSNTIIASTIEENLIYIPGGSFIMGDNFEDSAGRELPTHLVSISAFYMQKFEVSKFLWDSVYIWATNNGYRFNNYGAAKATNHPVHIVSWHDVVKWCNARSEMEGRTPAYYTSDAKTTVYRTGGITVQNGWVNWNSGYRLPTEAEWEYAARGGVSGQRFPWGNTIKHSQANYYSSSNSITPYDISPTSGYHPTYYTGSTPYTSPGGSFPPNGFGLYDMAGNVQEWCWDMQSEYSSDSQTDPRGPTYGYGRIFRGGCFAEPALFCRVAKRGNYVPSDAYYGVGFRYVLPLGQP